MGTSTSVAQFALKFDELAKHQGKTNRDAVFAASFVYKDEALLAAKREVGSDLRISRWGAAKKSDQMGEGVKARTGRKLNVGFDIKGTINATSILKPRPQGVWKVLEAGAQAHPMVAGVSRRRYNIQKNKLAEKGYDLTRNKLLSARKSSMARRALALSSGDFRAAVMHPGTKGKKTWSRAIAIARPKAMDVYAASTFKSHTEIMR